MIPDSINAPAVVMRQEVTPDDDSDDEDDDDDTSDDDDDGDDSDDSSAAAPSPTVGPGYAVGDGCVFISLEVDATTQVGHVGGQLGSILGRRQNVTTFVPKSTITIRQMTPTAYGDVIARFAMDTVPGSASINQASIVMGGFVGGIDTSFFDAWTADEFSFRALASSQSPALFGYTWRPTDTLALSVSAEDQYFRRAGLTGYAGQSLPDLVGRARLVVDPFDLTLSGAFHETRLTRPSDGTIKGVALQASLKVAVPTAQDGSYVIAQGTWSRDAPGYLGIVTTNSPFSLPVGGLFDASVAERSTGWSGALVGYWQLAPTWSSAAFVSLLSLDVPLAAARAPGQSIRSFRSALNVSWQPVDSFSITLEAGFSRLESNLVLLPSSNSGTLILSLQRSF